MMKCYELLVFTVVAVSFISLITAQDSDKAADSPETDKQKKEKEEKEEIKTMLADLKDVINKLQKPTDSDNIKDLTKKFRDLLKQLTEKKSDFFDEYGKKLFKELSELFKTLPSSGETAPTEEILNKVSDLVNKLATKLPTIPNNSILQLFKLMALIAHYRNQNSSPMGGYPSTMYNGRVEMSNCRCTCNGGSSSGRSPWSYGMDEGYYSGGMYDSNVWPFSLGTPRFIRGK